MTETKNKSIDYNTTVSYREEKELRALIVLKAWTIVFNIFILIVFRRFFAYNLTELLRINKVKEMLISYLMYKAGTGVSVKVVWEVFKVLKVLIQLCKNTQL